MDASSVGGADGGSLGSPEPPGSSSKLSVMFSWLIGRRKQPSASSPQSPERVASAPVPAAPSRSPSALLAPLIEVQPASPLGAPHSTTSGSPSPSRQGADTSGRSGTPQAEKPVGRQESSPTASSAVAVIPSNPTGAPLSPARATGSITGPDLAPASIANLARSPSPSPEDGPSRRISRVASTDRRAQQNVPQGEIRADAALQALADARRPVARARDSQLQPAEVSLAAREEEPQERTTERLRPAPLQIPDDPRATPVARYQPVSGVPLQGQVAGAAADGGPMEAQAAKPKESGWARLSRALGAIVPKRWLSPSKEGAGAAPAQPAPPGVAADVANRSAHSLAVSSSQLPMPAFPVPRPGAGALNTSMTSQLSSRPLVAPSSPGSLPLWRFGPSPSRLGRLGASDTESPPGISVVQQRQQRRRGDEVVEAGKEKTKAGPVAMDTPFLRMAQQLQGLVEEPGPSAEPVRTSRKSRRSRARSDLLPRQEGLGRDRNADGRRSGQGRPASAGAAMPADGTGHPVSPLRAPAYVPRGRSVSPLGRSMAEAAGRSASGGIRWPPVAVVPPLAAAPPGQVLISPLRPTPSPAAIAAAGPPGAAPWAVDGQDVLISADRIPRISSVLFPSAAGRRPVSPPSHLPRQQHAGLRYYGASFFAPQAAPATTGPAVFPASIPAPLRTTRLHLDSTLGSDQPLLGSVGLGSTGARHGTMASSLSFAAANIGLNPGPFQLNTGFVQGAAEQQPVRQQAAALDSGLVLQLRPEQALNDEGLPAVVTQVPVRSLRTPLMLGLRQPGVGLMLSQAPEAVQAVVEAEAAAAQERAAAEAGLQPSGSPSRLQGVAWSPGLAHGHGQGPVPNTAVSPSRAVGSDGVHVAAGDSRRRRALFVSGSGPMAAPGGSVRLWHGDATQILSSATDLLQAGVASPVPPARTASPQQLPPSAYRRHRPLGLGRVPAEPYPSLRRPDPPPLLDPEMPYSTAAPVIPPGTADVLHEWRQAGQVARGRASLTAGLGGAVGDDDDSSSLASSATANSLREMHPTLALELRRRELMDPLGLRTGGVSGVTVRTLQREVTAGPHVKLMKPKQLLSQVQHAGTTFTFVRRNPVSSEADQAPGEVDVLSNKENTLDPLDASPAPIADNAAAATAEEPDGAQPAGIGVVRATDQGDASHQSDPSGTPSRQPSQQPSRQPSQQRAQPRSKEASQQPSRQPSQQPSREPSGPQGRPWHEEKEAAQLARDPSVPVTFVRVEGTGLPGVRPLAPPPLPAASRSPPRLLRVPQPPGAHQPTRRHVQLGAGAEEPHEPRFLNVKLMRVLNPPGPAEGPADKKPPDMQAPPGLPMRRLRVLDRPEAELPGIVPAGTAGRTEHLLGMLRRPEERPRGGAGIGHRVGLFDRPLGGAQQTADAAAQAESDAEAQPPAATPREVSAAAVQAVAPTGVQATWTSDHGQTASANRSVPDAEAQAAHPIPAIDIFVHSSTSAAPSTAAPAAMPLPAPPPPPPERPPHQQPAPMPQPMAAASPPQPPQPIVVAAAAPGALAGLAALSQLTALTALTGLGAAVGPPPEDDPSSWPDLMETTPETLRQTAETTTARWRQERTILAQHNAGTLRSMDPALQLEPPQMLGPGPLGEAQYAMRMAAAAVAAAPAGTDGFRVPGAGDSPPSRPDSPGLWLLSKSRDGRVLAVGSPDGEGDRRREPHSQRQQQHPRCPGQDAEAWRGAETEGLSWREQERRRRRSGLGAADVVGERRGPAATRRGSSDQDSEEDRHRHRRRWRRSRSRRRRSSSDSRTRRRHSRRSRDPSSESASSGYSSHGHGGGRGSRQRRRSKGRTYDQQHRGQAGGHAEAAGGTPAAPPDIPAAPTAAVAPLQTRTTACQTADADAATETSEPAAPRPEPGDDFGMELAEKLLRRMMGDDPGGPRTGSSAGLAKIHTSSAGEHGPSQQSAEMAAAEHQGVEEEAVSPPGRLRLLERPEADTRDSDSPHAKMVDVLHGPDTALKAQEILARQASLRAKFLAAADNLRTVVGAGFPNAMAGAASRLPAGPSAAGGGSELSLASEPTLGQLQPDSHSTTAAATGAAQGPQSAPASQAIATAKETAGPPQPPPGSDASLVPPSNAAVVPVSITGDVTRPPAATYITHGTMAGPPPHQAINIYCTQLVLNPGAGPITVPGMPAYYPAPGPAAWAGVPTAVPVVPSPPRPGYAGSVSVGEHHGRAVYLQSPGRPLAAAVPVSPVGTASWLPPGRRPGEPPHPASSPSSGDMVPLARPGVGKAGTPDASAGSAEVGRAASGTLHGEASAPASVPSSVAGSDRASKGRSRGASGAGDLPQRPRNLEAAGAPSAMADDTSAAAAVEEEEVVSLHSQPSSERSKHAEPEQREGFTSETVTSADQSSVSTTPVAPPAGGDAAPPGSTAIQGPEQPGSSNVVAGPGGGATGDSTEAAGGKREPDQKAQLAMELTQLIMEAFQQSGGVITPPNAATAANPAAGAGALPPRRVTAPSQLGAAAATVTAMTGAPASEAAPSAPPRLPSTLPNASVPRGKGPSFLQIHDIELTQAGPAGDAGAGTDYLEAAIDPATDTVATHILSGLGDWEAQVMSALQGRPPQDPLLPRYSSGALGSQVHPFAAQWQDAYAQLQYGPGEALEGGDLARDLTASEALVMEPNPAQQRALQALRQRRDQRAAALAEKQARYRAGLENFADPSRQLRPLHLPPPQHPPPPDVVYEEDLELQHAGEPHLPYPPEHASAGPRPGGGGVYLTRGALDGGGGPGGWVAGGGTGAPTGGPRSSTRRNRGGEDTHETLFPRQPQYLAGPGLEQQPHPHSPLQRRMHGEARPRRRWSRPEISPKAASLFQHQRNFTAQVRSALRSPGRTALAASPARGTVTFADGTLHDGSDGGGVVAPGGTVTGGGGRVPYMARVSPATAAVRSLAAMVAQRVEGGTGARRNLQPAYDGAARGRPAGASVWGDSDDGDEDWGPDTDALGPENECGGCDYVGCPVHGSGAREERERQEQTGAAAGGGQSGATQRTRGTDRLGDTQGSAGAAAEEALAARQQREQQRAQLLDRWMAEMRQLSAATARAEATKQVAVASAQQALNARRERQAAELAGIFNLLGEVDELAHTMEQQTQDTKRMMQALEEEAELRQVSRLNSLLFEARKLGGQVDKALEANEGHTSGTTPPVG